MLVAPEMVQSLRQSRCNHNSGTKGRRSPENRDRSSIAGLLRGWEVGDNPWPGPSTPSAQYFRDSTPRNRVVKKQLQCRITIRWTIRYDPISAARLCGSQATLPWPVRLQPKAPNAGSPCKNFKCDEGPDQKGKVTRFPEQGRHPAAGPGPIIHPVNFAGQANR